MAFESKSNTTAFNRKPGIHEPLGASLCPMEKKCRTRSHWGVRASLQETSIDSYCYRLKYSRFWSGKILWRAQQFFSIMKFWKIVKIVKFEFSMINLCRNCRIFLNFIIEQNCWARHRNFPVFKLYTLLPLQKLIANKNV